MNHETEAEDKQISFISRLLLICHFSYRILNSETELVSAITKIPSDYSQITGRKNQKEG